MDLKIKDVAELLNVSETTIRRWLSSGKIPAYRLNHQFRFSRIEIENWVMGCKMGQRQDYYPLSTEKKESLTGTQHFSLYRAIHKGNLLIDVEGDTKEEIIRSSIKEISINRDWDAGVITDLLLDREKLGPTALNRGVGVPHTRDFLIKDSFDVVCVVYPKEPIPYGALDQEPVHTLFFLFACQDKRHLHLLAKLAHLVSDDEALKFLKTKPDKVTLLNFIKTWESKINQPSKEEVIV